MTNAEWRKLAVELQARWPQREIPDESISIWFTDLEDLSADAVRAGLLALYRDGREFAPNGGQIRRKVEEISRSAEPDHGEAWALAYEAVCKFGCCIPDNQRDGMAWLEDRSALVAEAVRRYGYRELALCNVADLGTVRAQFREIFNRLAQRAERSQRYAGLPGVPQRQLAPRRMSEVIAATRRQLGEGAEAA